MASSFFIVFASFSFPHPLSFPFLLRRKDIRVSNNILLRGNPTRTIRDLSSFRCVPTDANLVTVINGLTVLTNRVYADLTRSHQIYDDVFQRYCLRTINAPLRTRRTSVLTRYIVFLLFPRNCRIGNVSYFNIVYKNHMKMVSHLARFFVNGLCMGAVFWNLDCSCRKKKEGNQVRTLTIRLFFPGLVYLQKCLKSMGTPSLPILLLSVSIDSFISSRSDELWFWKKENSMGC